MRVLIDIGNSRIKAGLLRGKAIHSLKPCEWRKVPPQSAWTAVLSGLTRPEGVYVSNVAGNAIATALNAWVKDHWDLAPNFVTVRRDCVGVRTCYDRPAQLGIDRWLAAIAGFHLAKGPACVVDAGTALTVDVVSAAGVHVGGMITPGLGLMTKSLMQGTAQLALDEVQSINNFATNTAGAISFGCREAVAGLIARVAERWRLDLKEEPTWYVTGGEADAIIDLSPVALHKVPDLVLQGIAMVEELIA
jgi:type III pantothenate kinase